MAPANKRRKLSNEDMIPADSTKTEVEVESVLNKDAKDAKDQRRSLFVRSLPASVTTESLTEHFSQSYPLKHATVVLDKTTGISRGFGFVTFTDAEDAQNAVKDFNDSVLGGRKIKVEIAESRNREVDEDLATGRPKSSVNVKAQELRAERQKQQQDNQPPKLIVRNLPWSIKTSDDLAKLFLSYGKVKHAVVPKLTTSAKGGPQQQAGFGIVILRGKKNAEKAMDGLNGKEVDGRTLALDWAVDKETWARVKDGQADNQEKDDSADTVDVNAESTMKETIADDDTSSEGSILEGDDGSEMEDIDMDGGANISDDDEDMNDELDGDLEDSAMSTIDTTSKPDTNNTTIFIRNLPFTADDDSLYEHFKTNFGPVRYARVVYEADTERSRGTAFVSFYKEDVARECVKNAPKHSGTQDDSKHDRKKRTEPLTHSVLENEMSDPSGKYTLEGRILQIARALPKVDADRRAEESAQKRSENKRRLYLLSEGTIPNGSQLYKLLGKAEVDIRESSSRQRQKLVKTNPNLGLSLARLSVRNIPRSLSSKELKALAREAVVGFAKDVKEGKRQPLNKEELTRGGEEDREAELMRKKKGKGMVKQVKIVFESDKTGSKVGEGKGGRSRGYGFIEYYGHRHALMGLRWLNGHLIKVKAGDGEDRNKRLIVEFAIENAQVVQRRAERENRFREGGVGNKQDLNGSKKRIRDTEDDNESGPAKKMQKQKRQPEKGTKPRQETADKAKTNDSAATQDEKNKTAARNRIISQKRQKRRVRKGKA